MERRKNRAVVRGNTTVVTIPPSARCDTSSASDETSRKGRDTLRDRGPATVLGEKLHAVAGRGGRRAVVAVGQDHLEAGDHAELVAVDLDDPGVVAVRGPREAGLRAEDQRQRARALHRPRAVRTARVEEPVRVVRALGRAEDALHGGRQDRQRARVHVADAADAAAVADALHGVLQVDAHPVGFQQHRAKIARRAQAKLPLRVRRGEREGRALPEVRGLRDEAVARLQVGRGGEIDLVGVGEVIEEVVAVHGLLALLLEAEDQVDPLREQRRHHRPFERLHVAREKRLRRGGAEQRGRQSDVVDLGAALQGSKVVVVAVDQEVGGEEPLGRELLHLGEVLVAGPPRDEHRVEQPVRHVEVPVLQPHVQRRVRLLAQQVVQHAPQRRAVVRAVVVRRHDALQHLVRLVRLLRVLHQLVVQLLAVVVALQTALEPVDVQVQPLRVLRAHRQAQIARVLHRPAADPAPPRLRHVEVHRRVVVEDPREDRVLRDVLHAAPRDRVQLHQVREVAHVPARPDLRQSFALHHFERRFVELLHAAVRPRHSLRQLRVHLVSTRLRLSPSLRAHLLGEIEKHAVPEAAVAVEELQRGLLAAIGPLVQRLHRAQRVPLHGTHRAERLHLGDHRHFVHARRLRRDGELQDVPAEGHHAPLDVEHGHLQTLPLPERRGPRRTPRRRGSRLLASLPPVPRTLVRARRRRDPPLLAPHAGRVHVRIHHEIAAATQVEALGAQLVLLVRRALAQPLLQTRLVHLQRRVGPGFPLHARRGDALLAVEAGRRDGLGVGLPGDLLDDGLAVGEENEGLAVQLGEHEVRERPETQRGLAEGARDPDDRGVDVGELADALEDRFLLLRSRKL